MWNHVRDDPTAPRKHRKRLDTVFKPTRRHSPPPSWPSLPLTTQVPMSSELDFLITVGHDMRVVSHVYLVPITDMKHRVSTAVKVIHP